MQNKRVVRKKEKSGRKLPGFFAGVYDRKKKISTAKNGAMQAPIKSSS